MAAEPENAASRRQAEGYSRWNDRRYVETELEARFADDYIREDRRRIVSTPAADGKTHVEQLLAWFDLEEGPPRFSHVATIAVRGDRLALSRLRIGFGSGTGVEMLALVQYDEAIDKAQRAVLFDVDDVDAAIDELDRLHRAIGGD